MFGSDEPVPMVIEAVVRLVLLVVRSVFRLVRFAVRRPRVASAAGSLLVLDRYAGHAAVLAVLAAIAVALGVWRVAWPDSYTVQVRPRLRRCWLLATYPRKWRRIASRVGLVVQDHTDGTTPWVYGGLGDVRVTPTGIIRLRVAIPTGLTLDDYARKADALAVAFGVREARVTASGPGSVWIELHRCDVLADTIAPLPVKPEPEVNLAGIPVGRHEDGTNWLFSIWQTHVLIAGATGAGKGSILWSLLRGLSPAIHAGWVQVGPSTPRAAWNCAPDNACSAGLRTAPRRRCATCSKTSSPSWMPGPRPSPGKGSGSTSRPRTRRTCSP
jgi:S-DNA-T family DNA segregation ATPase FtsK/SpoIIIE